MNVTHGAEDVSPLVFLGTMQLTDNMISRYTSRLVTSPFRYKTYLGQSTAAGFMRLFGMNVTHGGEDVSPLVFLGSEPPPRVD